MPLLRVRATLDWTAEDDATTVLLVRVGEADGQRVREEDLDVDGAEVEDPGLRWDGARPLRLHATAGQVELRYAATVEVDDDVPDTDVELPTLRDLDLALLRWTLPSRYCPSDVIGPSARAVFGDRPRTGALLEEVRTWVEEHVAYVPGTSDAHTAADETLLRRTGVCRDLAHLTASLLRGLGVPARLVAAYALDLDPPDFHAVVEAHDGVEWRLLDATGLAPVGTLVRIVTGRDAADIAWGTTEGPLVLDDLQVSVEQL